MSPSFPLPRVGTALEFSYPVDNRIRVSTRLRRRRFVVESIRDCEREPIEDWAVALRPDLRRGRLLLTGHDLETHQTRSFYLSSTRSLRQLLIPLSRLAVYDPTDHELPPEYFGPWWTNSSADRQRARRVIDEFNRRTAADPHLHLSVALFELVVPSKPVKLSLAG